MKTDIDKLHFIVDTRNSTINRRWSGQTFAKCHDVAGFIELETFNRIYVIVDYYEDISYIIPMLLDVLEEHQLPFERVDRFTLKSDELIVKFITERDEYKMRGYCDYGYIKMGHYD